MLGVIVIMSTVLQIVSAKGSSELRFVLFAVNAVSYRRLNYCTLDAAFHVLFGNSHA